jgi:pyruvate/2-oxoglutarate dehydrogenase complex dihydrolipoamide acyltransferase (E2) component
MPTPVLIPKATLTMEEANIVAWRKQRGAPVQKDEILFEMETDKVIVEVPSPASGTLLRIDVPEGVARLDQTIGWIGEPGETIPTQRTTRASSHVVTAPPPPVSAQVSVSSTAHATPAARRRARELGVDLASLQGTGPGGRITESDVEKAARQL